jgi:glycosyltransferase involved in cell wall biosynthesis
MKLSVIIPTYNEAATIGQIVKKLLPISDITQIIIVDDGSTDRTHRIVEQINDSRIIYVSHARNFGKGAAIRSGLKRVNGDYVLIQDADLEYDPEDIPLMLEPIKRHRCEVVYGSRFFGIHTNMFYWHYIGNRFLNWVVNILFNSILSDMETGYKVIPTPLFKSLHIHYSDFRIEPEITCKLLRRNIKILEVPISFVARSYAEGKKITWKDGFGALGTIIRLRFGE